MALKKLFTAFFAILFSFFALCIGSACTGDAFNFEGYEIIGASQIQNSLPYDFTSTLTDLYPQCNAIVLAQINETSAKSCRFLVEEVLLGDVEAGKVFTGHFDGIAPSTSYQYLFFLNKQADGSYSLLTDDAGWLRINGEEIFPSQIGGMSSLSQAEKTIQRLKNEILLPSRFYYYRELEELTLNSDYIFIATLEKRSLTVHDYFVRYGGVNTNLKSESGKLFTFQNEQNIKGDAGKAVRILLSSAMLQNTSQASNGQMVNYTLTDAPTLERDNKYLIFAIQASNLENFDAFFINPIQGFLPLLDDEYGFGIVTMSVPTNAPFVTEEYLDDVISEIETYMSGENISVQYEPFTVNSGGTNN